MTSTLLSYVPIALKLQTYTKYPKTQVNRWAGKWKEQKHDPIFLSL
jgi:hypothetical protein